MQRREREREREREKSTRESTQRECFPKAIGLENEGLNLLSSCKQLDLTPRVSKVSGLGWHRAQRALGCSWREGRQTTQEQKAWKELSEELLGTQWGDYLLFSKHILER